MDYEKRLREDVRYHFIRRAELSAGRSDPFPDECPGRLQAMTAEEARAAAGRLMGAVVVALDHRLLEIDYTGWTKHLSAARVRRVFASEILDLLEEVEGRC